MSKARELANLGNAYSDGALSNRNYAEIMRQVEAGGLIIAEAE